MGVGMGKTLMVRGSHTYTNTNRGFKGETLKKMEGEELRQDFVCFGLKFLKSVDGVIREEAIFSSADDCPAETFFFFF